MQILSLPSLLYIPLPKTQNGLSARAELSFVDVYFWGSSWRYFYIKIITFGENYTAAEAQY